MKRTVKTMLVLSLLFVFALGVRVYASDNQVANELEVVVNLPDGEALFTDGIQFALYEGGQRIDTQATRFGIAVFRNLSSRNFSELSLVLISDLSEFGFSTELSAVQSASFGWNEFRSGVVYYRFILTPSSATPQPTPTPTPVPTPTPGPTTTPGPTIEIGPDTIVRVYHTRATGFLVAYVDGHRLEVYGFLQNGRSMFPLRVFSEIFGIPVNWTGSLQRVTVYHPRGDVFLTIGSTDVQGTTMVLDSPPVLRVGTTFVPLRFLLELFEVPSDNFYFIQI